MRDRPATEWFEMLARRGIPAGPVYDTKDLWDDEQVRSRGLLTDVRFDETEFSAINHPVKFSDVDTEIDVGVPRLGEHSRETLKAVGYSDDEIDDFVKVGAVDEP